MITNCAVCGNDIEEKVKLFDQSGYPQNCLKCGNIVPHWTDRFSRIGSTPLWGRLIINFKKQHLDEITEFASYWHTLETTCPLAFHMSQFELYLASTKQHFVSVIPEEIHEALCRFFEIHSDLGAIISYKRLSPSEYSDLFKSRKFQPRPKSLPYDSEYDS